MKKEGFICLFIILLIVVLNILTQNYTKECVHIMNERLEVLKEGSLAQEIEADRIKAQLGDIENKWNEYQEKLAYYIEHDELEKVETKLFTMKGFCEIEKYDEIVPELEQCIFILEHISDKTKLNVKNIF